MKIDIMLDGADEISTGIMKIDPCSTKRERAFYAGELLFYVLSGDVRVTVDDVASAQNCTTGGEFKIFAQNKYSIENTSRNDFAKLYYKLTCPIEPNLDFTPSMP